MKNKFTLVVTIAFFSTVTSYSQVISSAGSHVLALCADSTVRSWGWNGNGQLGDGTTADKSSPTQVNSITGVKSLFAGTRHSFFVKSNGSVWACGYNFSGQLGIGTTGNVVTPPVLVGSISGVKAVAGGDAHSLFLKNDGTAWASGYNANDGRLGNGTYANSNIPVQVSNLTNLIAVSAGGYHSLFLKNDGTVWACGGNSRGQLGDGTTANKNVAVQVNGLSGIIAISAGFEHSLFLKNDGTVWSCGYNYHGELGNGTTTQNNSPIQVGSLSGIISIAAGKAHSLFVKNDGTAWACGYNYVGRLGDGTTTDKTTPIQVHGLNNVGFLTGITDVAAGGFNSYGHSVFLRNDGTIWTCGNGLALGNGGTSDSSTPVQVINLCQMAIGIEENNLRENILIFPNPSSALLNIKGINSKTTVKIYDMLGNLIIEKEAQTDLVIDINQFTDGLYTVLLNNGSGSYIHKIVKY